MKKMLAVILTAVLFCFGCIQPYSVFADTTTENIENQEKKHYRSLSDPQLLQFIEDNVYSDLSSEYNDEDHIIQNVNAIYISDDYLEEAEYNSKSNIFFGKTLGEIDKEFKGKPYVFTLSKRGKTKVTRFKSYDDTYKKVIKNVSVGTGVILVCVTVSAITGGGATPVSMIFAASAKTGTTVALSSGIFSTAFSAATTGIKTKNVKKTVKAAVLEGSKGFKWGAIAGSLIGGISKAGTLYNAAKTAKDGSYVLDKTAPAWRQAEERALQKYGGSEQVTYLGGKEVPFGTPGATRPDIVRKVGNHIEAIEVKYYNLGDSSSRSELYRELLREVTDRVNNLPKGSTQKIVLDVTGRGFPEDLVEDVVAAIHLRLNSVYPNIPIDVVGL